MRDDEEGFDEIGVSRGGAEYLAALDTEYAGEVSHQSSKQVLTANQRDRPTSTSQTLIVLSHDPVTMRSRLLVPVVTW